ncbi:MAG: chemotaxis protein CheW [Desulfuromonadales bacterium]|nr:chemotaxis protein CheW [Desulfuromonadales bacterium]
MTLTLIFALGEADYGLEIDAIQEIIEDPPLHYVPRASGSLIGAINFHGQVLAVIDLPGLLGFSSEKRDHRQLVLTPRCKSLVLTVSNIQKIVQLDLATLQPPPANSESGAIRGVASLDEMKINLLDTDKVINQLRNPPT